MLMRLVEKMANNRIMYLHKGRQQGQQQLAISLGHLTKQSNPTLPHLASEDSDQKLKAIDPRQKAEQIAKRANVSHL